MSVENFEQEAWDWYCSVLAAHGKTVDRFHIVACVRKLIEETAELALEFGLSPAEIQLHVTESICNQSRKEGRWPSKMNVPPRQLDLFEAADEIADVEVLAGFIKNGLRALQTQWPGLSGFKQLPDDWIEQRRDAKLEKNRSQPPEAWHISDNGLLYRQRHTGLEG